MDAFALIVFGSLAAAFVLFVGLGHIWRNRPLEEITDKRANEKYATQMQIEEGDIPQMVAASNEYRRKRGLPAVSVAAFRQKVGREQRELLEQGRKQLAAKRRRGAGSAREKRGF